jgi:hypothetical protein
MAPTISTLKYYAISRDGPDNFIYLPPGINDYAETPGFEPAILLNGDTQMPELFGLVLLADTMTWQSWLKLNDLYQVGSQDVLLNYLSPYSDLVSGRRVERWYYGSAKFGKPVIKGQSRGGVIKSVSIPFTNVDWYLP